MRHRVTWLAGLAFALQLLLLSAASGLVVCVESDGHFAVESGGVTGCGSLAAPARACDEISQATPCSDTPLTQDHSISSQQARIDDAHAATTTLPLPEPSLSRTTLALGRTHMLVLGEASGPPAVGSLRL